MPRTWVVRFVAMELTLSVRSFQVPPTPRTSAWPPSFPSVPTSRATRVTSEAKELSWSTMVLMVFFSSRISPLTSTVIFFDRSPRATAVVTSAMLRTWVVRLEAIELTLSVRSFQVPPTPLTSAWPPSFPSVPTSRATRVTSEAKELSWSTMVLMVFFSSRISPLTSTVIFFDRSPPATAVVTSAMLRTWVVRLEAIELTLSVRSFQVPPTPRTTAWPPSFPSVPTSRATRVTSEAKELSWSTMVLMVFFSSRISPLTSTVIFFDRSPPATAVVTSAMLRTWVVRLEAIELTLSVRSFQVPPTPRTTAWPPSFPSVPTSRATRVTSEAKELSWSTMVLMVFFSSRISPLTSTVIFFDRSPLATAVVTSAMLRTWEVRLEAIELTLSVRSFQVPPTPRTTAWPPSFPPVPTSRATRVTSEAKEPSCSTIPLTRLAVLRNSPCSSRWPTFRATRCERSPWATAPITRPISLVGCTSASTSAFTECTFAAQAPPAPVSRARSPIRPSSPTASRSRANSAAVRSLRSMMSLRALATLRPTPLPLMGMRTAKSPFFTALSTRKSSFVSRPGGSTRIVAIASSLCGIAGLAVCRAVRLFRGLAIGIGDPVAAQPLPKGLSRDAEQIGRLGAPALRLLHGAPHVLALEFTHGFGERAQLGAPRAVLRRLRAGDLGRQVLEIHLASLAHDDRVLDGVAELADVPGEGVLGQRGQRPRRDPRRRGRLGELAQ